MTINPLIQHNLHPTSNFMANSVKAEPNHSRKARKINGSHIPILNILLRESKLWKKTKYNISIILQIQNQMC